MALVDQNILEMHEFFRFFVDAADCGKCEFADFLASFAGGIYSRVNGWVIAQQLLIVLL